MKLISSYLDNTFSFAIIGNKMIKLLHRVESAIKQEISFLLAEDQKRRRRRRRKERTVGENLHYSKPAGYIGLGTAGVREGVVEKDVTCDYLI